MKLCKWILFFTLLALTACAPAGAPATTPTGAPLPATGGTAPDGLGNIQWQLVSFTEGGTEIPVVEGNRPLTLAFQDSGRVEGHGGCNTFGGEYQVEGGSVTFSKLFSTMMACPEEDRTQQETRFLAALESATRFEVTGDSLTIWYGAGEDNLTFTRMGA